jgi:hypothetical protein
MPPEDPGAQGRCRQPYVSGSFGQRIGGLIAVEGDTLAAADAHGWMIAVNPEGAK